MAAQCPRILLVEDSPTQAVEIEALLEDAGFDPVTVHDGAAALERLGAEPFDGVLLDVILPGMSGFEVCRRIRGNPSTAEIPIVLLTTLNDTADIVRGMEAGADAYLNKPCRPERIAAALRRVLAGSAERRRLQEAMRNVADPGRAIGYLLAVVDQFAASRRAADSSGDLAEGLRRSEERFALAAAGANDGLWDWDLRSGQAYFSPRWCEIAGESPERLSPDLNEWLSRVHPDDRERVESLLDAAVKGELPRLEVEHRLRHSSGAWRWVLVRGFVLRDAAGRANRAAGSLTDLTERKELEQRLLDAQFELEALFRSFPDVYGRLDENLVVRDVHLGAPGGLRIDPGQIVGRPLAELVPAEAAEAVVAAARKARETGHVQAVEFILPSEKGPRYAEVRFAPIRGSSELLAIGRDVGRWRRVEARLREVRLQLETAVTAAGLGVWSWDPGTNRCEVDDRVLELFGVERGEFDGTPDSLIARVDAADRERLLEAMRNVHGGGPPWDLEYTVRLGDGRTRRLRSWSQRDPAGRGRRIVGVLRDVSREYEERERLLREYERVRATLASAPFGVVRLDREGRIVDANAAAAFALQAEQEALAGRTWPSLGWVAPEEVAAELEAIFASPCDSMHVEHDFLAGGQVRRTIRLAYAPERSAQESIEHVIVALMDVTGEREALRQLAESERKFRELVETVQDVVFAADRSGTLTYISPVIHEASGYRPEEVIGRPFADFVHPEDLADLRKSFRRALAGRPAPAEYRVLTREGSPVRVRSFSRPVHDERGHVVGIRGVLVRLSGLEEAGKAR